MINENAVFVSPGVFSGCKNNLYTIVLHNADHSIERVDLDKYHFVIWNFAHLYPIAFSDLKDKIISAWREIGWMNSPDLETSITDLQDVRLLDVELFDEKDIAAMAERNCTHATNMVEYSKMWARIRLHYCPLSLKTLPKFGGAAEVRKDALWNSIRKPLLSGFEKKLLRSLEAGNSMFDFYLSQKFLYDDDSLASLINSSVDTLLDKNYLLAPGWEMYIERMVEINENELLSASELRKKIGEGERDRYYRVSGNSSAIA